MTLNDTNLHEYLSELEDYTNKILIYKGKVSNQKQTEIYGKALLIDDLPPKSFNKKIYVKMR